MAGIIGSLKCYNTTSRHVCVMYLNSNNEPDFQQVLSPGMYFEVDDAIYYTDNPWICFDVNTRSELLLNGEKRYYIPTATINENYDYSRAREDEDYYYTYAWRREFVYITLPVFSLVQRCAEIIMDNIKSKDDVNLLPIPEPLKEMLLRN